MAVANRTPKDNETAIGIMNFACVLFSRISGISPTKVVNEVRKIGLNLLGPYSSTASFMLFPSDL